MSCHIGSRRLLKSSKFGTCDLHRTYTRALTFENVCLCALEAHSQTVLAVLIVPKNKRSFAGASRSVVNSVVKNRIA